MQWGGQMLGLAAGQVVRGAALGPLLGVGWVRAGVQGWVERCSAFRLPFRGLLGWAAAA